MQSNPKDDYISFMDNLKRIAQPIIPDFFEKFQKMNMLSSAIKGLDLVQKFERIHFQTKILDNISSDFKANFYLNTIPGLKHDYPYINNIEHLINSTKKMYSALETILEPSYFNNFNQAISLAQTLEKISTTHLKDLSKTKNQDFINYYVNITDEITDAVEAMQAPENGSTNAIVNFERLLNNIIVIYNNPEIRKNIKRIYEILTVIYFLGTFSGLFDLSNKASTETILSKLEEIKKIEQENTANKNINSGVQRIANTNVKLRQKPNPKSLVLTKLYKDQLVQVIHIQKQWMFIYFYDENGFQTGWVMKKYFSK